MPLPMRGQFCSQLSFRDRIVRKTFFVVDKSAIPVVSCQTAVALDLVRLVKNVRVPPKYPTIFQGIGKLKDHQLKIHIDATVQPVAQQHRHIPFHTRQLVEQELEKLEALDIIERVEGPTPWVSPVVVAPKPKQPGKI